MKTCSREVKGDLTYVYDTYTICVYIIHDKTRSRLPESGDGVNAGGAAVEEEGGIDEVVALGILGRKLGAFLRITIE